MMNKVIIIALGLFIASCSSEPKKASTAQVKKRNDVVRPAANPVQIQDVKGDVKYQALSVALKSKAWHQLYQESVAILEKDNNDVKALNGMGIYYYNTKKYGAAKLMFSRALKINQNAELYNNLGVSQLALSENEDAKNSFRKAIELDSADVLANANLGSLFLEYGDIEKSKIAFQNVMAKGLSNNLFLNNYAVMLSVTGEPEKAREYFIKVLKEIPTNKSVQLNYAALLILRLNKPTEGLEILNKLKFAGIGPDNRTLVDLLDEKARGVTK